MKEIKEIAIIGSGRVATHLGTAFAKNDLTIRGVYDRDADKAKVLADRLKATVIRSLDSRIKADLIIIAVSDDAVASVARKLSEDNTALVVHTSGAVAMTVIPSYLRRGVLYPLQSFSYDKKILWENVPFCLEAGADSDVNLLGTLAQRLSTRVFLLDSAQRKSLHLAAVFANNFANLMFEFAEELLDKAEIERSILHPLILETANKVLMQRASEAQTGPARRGDLDTIRAHQDLLGDANGLRHIYDLLTEEIYKRSQHG